jgi:hypothetical protein
VPGDTQETEGERALERQLEELRAVVKELPLPPHQRATLESARVFVRVGLGGAFIVGLVALLLSSVLIGRALSLGGLALNILQLVTVVIGGAAVFQTFARAARRLELRAYRAACRRFEARGVVPALTSTETTAAVPGTRS